MIMEIPAGLRTRRIVDYEFDQEWWLKQQRKNMIMRMIQYKAASNPQTFLTKMVMFNSDLSDCQETGVQYAELVYWGGQKMLKRKIYFKQTRFIT